MSDAGRTITLLGRVAIGPGGGSPETPTGRGRRAELVFAYLAAEHRRVVTHDELADALWPAGLPDTWEAALRGAMTEVRRLLTESGLDPTALTTARRGYQMRLPADVIVDLDVARDAFADARARAAEGAHSRAAERAAHASDLAELPFLPNHEGEWVDAQRRELATMHARALEIEARAHGAAGDLTAAATAAERLVRVEPFNETAHQLRIRLLGQAGDRSGAVKAYEHCREVLAAELGIEPSDETRAALRAATTEPAARVAPHATPLEHLTVLVVEDHDFQRRTAVMLLRNLGVEDVSDASDGAAALQLLGEAARPDVIVCDIDMPGMDGLEFIRHVAEGELAGAVIIASALDSKVVHAVRAVGEGYGLQVLGAIEKPLTARRLGELLAAYRRRPRPPQAAAASLVAAAAPDALRAGDITFHLRPAVDVSTGAVTTADAVPRWRSADGAWISPALFVPVLEREGLLGDLAWRALELACAQVVEHAGRGLGIEISIELPPLLVQDADLADRAAAIARASGTEPARVTLELDERAVRHRPAVALDILTRLRVKGFGVALGGLSTGHSSAEQLRRLPLTAVKLDPMLVSGAGSDPEQARALEEVVEVGRGLDVAVVAPGCDTDDDLGVVLSLGCDRVQGALIAEAMPGAELPRWADQWDPGRLDVGGRG